MNDVEFSTGANRVCEDVKTKGEGRGGAAESDLRRK